MKKDYEIALEAQKKPIADVAAEYGLDAVNDIELYGKYKAKITNSAYEKLRRNAKKGRLVLVTAVSPTPFGEGKTTVSIGLAQGFQKIGVKSCLALREPSLGPVFGVKGGATGGGYSQILPADEINLHFTGDFHAITAANNLLCAAVDNHIYQGNELDIDPEAVTFKRCLDVNDRALRNITIGLGAKTDGVPRNAGFAITAASEIMAVLCLSEDLEQLKDNLADITIGYTHTGKPIRCRDLKIEGAMTALLKDAIMPNLIQTTEGGAAIVHGGPFANIAHGCNSVRATRLARGLGEVAVTEAGFGADLGAEKYMNIKCRRFSDCAPSAVVIVVTVRGMKYNGGADKSELTTENLQALEEGFANFLRHYENVKKFGVKAVAALNRFPSDTDAEINRVKELCAAENIPCEVSEGFAKGGDGAVNLAKLVWEVCNEKDTSEISLIYNDSDSIEVKIKKIASEIYHADFVEFSEAAKASIARAESLGFGHYPVCIAKTQYSFTDDPKALGAPEGFTLHIRDAILQTGAKFIVALTGAVMTMPGLPKVPAAEGINVDQDNNITGIF